MVQTGPVSGPDYLSGVDQLPLCEEKRTRVFEIWDLEVRNIIKSSFRASIRRDPASTQRKISGFAGERQAPKMVPGEWPPDPANAIRLRRRVFLAAGVDIPWHGETNRAETRRLAEMVMEEAE